MPPTVVVEMALSSSRIDGCEERKERRKKALSTDGMNRSWKSGFRPRVVREVCVW